MSDSSFRVPSPERRLAMALAIVGAIAVGVGLIAAPEATATHLLLVGFLGVCLGLAGALFVALHYVSGAGWSTALRRVPEAMVAALPVGGALLLATLVLFPSLYPWTDPHLHLHGDFKHLWLQRPFFLIRSVAYLAVWMLAARALVSASRRQDVDGSLGHTFANRRRSAIFLVVFGATFWLAAYDWAMSREPEWVSTIYGLYHFAGLFSGGWATFVLLALWLRRVGPFREILSERHRHDLGKLLFGMCVFWLYIWYCQYMLIWFVNNPEETPHYLRRFVGLWGTAFWANMLLGGAIPFLALLPKRFKEHPKILANVCVVVLAGRWLDLCQLFFPESATFGQVALGVLIALGGAAAYFLTIGAALGKAPLVPRHDPFLGESLAAHDGHAPQVLRSAPTGESA